MALLHFSRVIKVSLLLSAFGLASGARAEQTKVNVAIIPTLEAAPLVIAKEKGLFAHNGLDVTIQIGTSGATILPGVLSGQYDIGYANVVSDLQAIDRKLPILLIHATYSHPTDAASDPYKIYVAPDSKFTDPRQLATANIGTPYINNISEWTTKKALENLQVTDFSRLRWTKVSGEDAYSSVKSGTIDAVWLAQPAGAAAVKAGLKPLLAVNAGSMPGAVGGYFITSQRYALANPEVIRRFNQVISQANDYVTQHQNEGRDAVITHFHFDRDLVYAAPLNNFTNDPGIDNLRIIANDLARYGLIKKAPDVNSVFWRN
ncbi:ABC-type nitrate/sulfonate/bicarbonate transportsystems periplasmic components-like protein (plasmid) [Sodalis praecaptivus]|uniref:ABC-type nitrate/sulfonate/bicarbonate transportsystems periplasmic components-like protein n=1 Tax=Sodalis praecaptivus TaxID=1239307 RepID=W0I3T8_9GAMM|nr:ABC transporter substrate-binding protein [Sodalis praecaptivus]AHF79088.1 ABC-type nitrate/sulfonate/bicarbonate transportsystems periplasmic components-like protein [Sodalis praecaptivus]